MCYKRNSGKSFLFLSCHAKEHPLAPCVALSRTKVEKTMKGTLKLSLYVAPFLRKALWVLRWQKKKNPIKQDSHKFNSVTCAVFAATPLGKKKSLHRRILSPEAISSTLIIKAEIEFLQMSKFANPMQIDRKKKKLGTQTRSGGGPSSTN